MFRLILLFFLLLSSQQLVGEEFAVTSTPTTLSGDWQICQLEPQSGVSSACQLVSVPGILEEAYPDFDGIVFYRTSFYLDPSLQQQSLALYIRQIRDADKVFINGHLIGQSGQFPPNFEKATLYKRVYPIASKVLKFDQSNELIIKVYNHARQGGMPLAAPVIGEVSQIYQDIAPQESLLMIFIGMILLISTVQIFYYLAQPAHRENLVFAVLCIFEVFYLLTYSQAAFESGINLTSIFRINILLFCILTVNFFLFVATFFNRPVSLPFKILLALILIMGVACVTVLPIDLIYLMLLLIQIISVLILVPYYFYVFHQARKQQLPYAQLMSLVLSIYILTVLVDFAIDQALLPPFITGIAGLLSPIFLIAVFIAITLILIHKHWLYYRHATYDYLTDCLRRSAFELRLAEEIQRIRRSGQSIVVAVIDIDEFKQINDQYNHLVGDQILQTVVNRTRASLRDFDLLGRYGGDEFIIAAEVTDEKDANHLLKRIHAAISEQPFIDKHGKPIHIDITIGAYVAQAMQEITALQMIELADEILIRGKVKQKGRIHI